MGGIDFSSSTAKEILQLKKTVVTKRLQAAVRESQGRARCSWAVEDCPDWWKYEADIALPNGKAVKALPFVPNYKATWAVQRARATLLLYEFRENLKEEVRHVSEDESDADRAQDEPGTDGAEDETGSDGVKDETGVEGEENVEAVEEATTVARKSRRRASQLLSGEGKDGGSAGEEQPAEGNNDNEGLDASTNEVPSISSDEEDDPEELKQAIAKLRKRVRERVQILEAECMKRKRRAKALHSNKIADLQASFKMYRMKTLPQQVQNMTIGDYLRDFNADSKEFLLKQIEDVVQRAHADPDAEKGSDARFDSPSTPGTKARREEVTATVKKASRAMRARQHMVGDTDGASTRARPVRSTAMKATTRNRAILGGGATTTDLVTPAANKANRMRGAAATQAKVSQMLATVRRDKPETEAKFIAEQTSKEEAEAQKRRILIMELTQELSEIEENISAWKNAASGS